MARISADPILLYKCGFGKHLGTLWSDVPKSYLNWAINNMTDMDDDL
jgi:uncharacterized protein (DUF3820 family)